jgi:hypothetical protein
MAAKYSKWPHNVPTFSIPRPSKFYPNGDFGFEDLATLVVTSRGGRANYGKKEESNNFKSRKKTKRKFRRATVANHPIFFFL